jgi:hypothetical protein
VLGFDRNRVSPCSGTASAEGPTLFDALAGVIVAAGWRIELCDAQGAVQEILAE